MPGQCSLSSSCSTGVMPCEASVDTSPVRHTFLKFAEPNWCLCAPRWQEALEAGQPPRVVLRATHEGALGHCSLADLKRLAVDLA